jgi:hypothetical protein
MTLPDGLDKPGPVRAAAIQPQILCFPAAKTGHGAQWRKMAPQAGMRGGRMRWPCAHTAEFIELNVHYKMGDTSPNAPLSRAAVSMVLQRPPGIFLKGLYATH